MIDGDDDVTDTVIVVTVPMETTYNYYNGPVYVTYINSRTVYGIGETTLPLQGIIISVISMKNRFSKMLEGLLIVIRHFVLL
ncbi:hypothetical protein [Candidatus Nitrosocosmicus sp. R]